MTHFQLGICPHNVSNRLTAPCVQVLSYIVTGDLHTNEAKIYVSPVEICKSPYNQWMQKLCQPSGDLQESIQAKDTKTKLHKTYFVSQKTVYKQVQCFCKLWARLASHGRQLTAQALAWRKYVSYLVR